jgi:hypothetical protein
VRTTAMASAAAPASARSFTCPTIRDMGMSFNVRSRIRTYPRTLDAGPWLPAYRRGNADCIARPAKSVAATFRGKLACTTVRQAFETDGDWPAPGCGWPGIRNSGDVTKCCWHDSLPDAFCVIRLSRRGAANCFGGEQ